MSPFDSPDDAGERLSGQVAALWRRAPAGIRRRSLLAGAGIVAAIAIAVGFGLSGRPAKQPGPAAPVPALTVAATTLVHRELTTTVSGVGTVVAWQELSIGAEAGGLRVAEVLADEGDDVKAGQVLARFDARVLAAQLKAQDARVAEAKSAVVVAQNNLRRAEELVRRGVISAATLDDRSSSAETAVARLNAAVASRDELATKLAQATIVAPEAGRISKRMILVGDVVNAGTVAFKLIRDHRLELDAEIGETELGLLSPDQPARVEHEGNAPVIGKIRTVAPTVDAKSRLGIAHISLPLDSGLKVGMYARAEITVAKAAVPVLPESAIVWQDTAASVFVVDADNRVHLRPVKIGTRDGTWLEIRDGVAASDRVIASGGGFLHDGDVVRVRPAPPAAAELEAANDRLR